MKMDLKYSKHFKSKKTIMKDPSSHINFYYINKTLNCIVGRKN
jgi:hypothetical protein